MKIQPLYWKLYIPQHIFFMIGLLTIINGTTSYWWLVATYIGYAVMGYIGGAIFIHRYWCHESFETYPFLARLGAYLGAMSGMGSPLAMTAVHLYMHHAYSDTEKDPHTPNFQGKFYSWVSWKNKPLEHFKPAFSLMLRSRKNVIRDKFVVYLHKNFDKIYWGTFLLLLIINWKFALFFYMGGGVLSFHIEGFVNTFCHGASSNGYRIADTDDKSMNHASKFMMFLSLGNTLHHNHHVFPKNYSYKLKDGEFDLAHYLVPLITTKYKNK